MSGELTPPGAYANGTQAAVQDGGGLAGRYAAALRSYLEGGGEGALQAAYEVGRHALEAGMGPLVLFSIHRDAVDRLPPQPPLDDDEFSGRVTAVFIESLAPFEMTYASLDSARVAVRELRATIRREAAELREMRGVLDSAREDASHDRLVELIGRHAAELDAARERLEGIAQTSSARKGLIADIVGAQEEERRRIAGEIHDDAVQVMAAVALRLGLLRRKAGDAHADAIGQLEGLVGEAIASLRRLIAGLRPAELERSGLASALRVTLEHAREEFGLQHRFVDLCEREPGAAARATAFRIAREAIVNVCKHAHAQQVEVRIAGTDDGLLTRVSDDGIGFDAVAVMATEQVGHLGLSAMRERAELAGGWLKVASGPDGSTVDFWIPDSEAR